MVIELHKEGFWPKAINQNSTACAVKRHDEVKSASQEVKSVIYKPYRGLQDIKETEYRDQSLLA
jgi:hypothetical protein